MNIFTRLIFGYSYNFSVFVTKEKEYSEYYAASIIAVVLFGIVALLFNAISSFYPDIIILGVISYNFKYLVLICISISCWYFGYKEHYRRYLLDFESINSTKKTIYSIILIFFLILSVILSYYILEVTRVIQ